MTLKVSLWKYVWKINPRKMKKKNLNLNVQQKNFSPFKQNIKWHFKSMRAVIARDKTETPEQQASSIVQSKRCYCFLLETRFTVRARWPLQYSTPIEENISLMSDDWCSLVLRCVALRSPRWCCRVAVRMCVTEDAQRDTVTVFLLWDLHSYFVLVCVSHSLNAGGVGREMRWW